MHRATASWNAVGNLGLSHACSQLIRVLSQPCFLVDTALIWVSDVCNGKNPDSYNGVNSIHLGVEAPGLL